MTSVTWDRHRGHANTYDIVDIGFNYRLDEPRAALGLSRLGRLEADLDRRREAVRAYRERLRGCDDLDLVFEDAQLDRSSHFAFAVLLPDRAARDAFRAALRQRGVQTTWYGAVHLFTEYRTRDGELSLPGVEAAADRHCVLPLASTMTADEVERVAEAVDAALAA
jgi:dTDP-4-amino-4,6-dideoxygalactose transaminase